MTPAKRAEEYRTSPYPGETPFGPFVISRGLVTPVVETAMGWELPDGTALDDWLELTDESSSRSSFVPLLSYGSNACPGRLAEKFGSLTDDLDRIAVFPVSVDGVDRVWSCQINSRNAVPATLAASPSHRLAAHLLLLPNELSASMDRTEGRGGRYYSACRLLMAPVELPDGSCWPLPLTYLGTARRAPLRYRGVVQRVDDVSQDAARQIVQSGDGSCAEGALPKRSDIPSDIPLPQVVDLKNQDAAVFRFLRHGVAAG
ncbi:MAG: hypothetical protein WCP28_19140 [Actinomycetes bacterium]